MKFRKLLLCMFAGLFLTGFANIYTYAAEEGNIVTVETTIDSETDQVTDLTSTATVTSKEEATTEETTEETTENAIEAEEDAKEATKESVNEAAEDKTKVTVEETTKKETTKKETTKKESTKTTKTTTKETTKKTNSTKKEEVNYTKAELRLLSALIYCEANGESYNGKLAVAIVVMNRVRAGSFPDTLKGVIYQKYQFGPINNGSLDRALAEYDAGKFTSSAEESCIKAAKEALNGTKSITVGGKSKDFSKYLFFSGRLQNATFSLGNHQFK